MAWHARGIEHHSQGVENCLTVINLCAATGHIGKPGAGYGTITGQGNGQGGREHGQKADLLCLSFLVVLGLWVLDPKDR